MLEIPMDKPHNSIPIHQHKIITSMMIPIKIVQDLWESKYTYIYPPSLIVIYFYFNFNFKLIDILVKTLELLLKDMELKLETKNYYIDIKKWHRSKLIRRKRI